MKWEPINTAPKDREVLLTDADTAGAYAVAHYDTSSEPGREGTPLWFTADGAGYHIDAFTHWMDLPPAPRGQIEEAQRADEVDAVESISEPDTSDQIDLEKAVGRAMMP